MTDTTTLEPIAPQTAPVQPETVPAIGSAGAASLRSGNPARMRRRNPYRCSAPRVAKES
jgi:hypothetical protein